MVRKTVVSSLTGILAGSLLVAPFAVSTVQAASSFGCEKFITHYQGFAGVWIDRGHVICWGKQANKTEYRGKFYCGLPGFGTSSIKYGTYKKMNSGKDSYNSCPWPWKVQSISYQTR